MQSPHRDARLSRQGDIVTDQDQPGRNDPPDPQEEIGGGAVVDRHDDDASQQAAPEGDDPFGPVLAEEDDRVAFSKSGAGQPGRKAACG